MKKIIFTLLMLTGIVNALHIDAFTPDLKQVSGLISSLRPLMEKPLSWCKIVETDNYEDYGSSILMLVRIDCDERNVNKTMDRIYKSYGEILKDKRYYPVIDSAFDANFPMYQMFWGDHQMAFDAFALDINPKPEFMRTNVGDFKKYLYMKVIVNGVEKDGVYFIDVGGSIISYRSKKGSDYNDDHYVESSMIDIKKEYKKNQSLDIQFKQVFTVDITDELISATKR